MTQLRFGLLGYPLETSLSPCMHAAAYRALGMPHSYELLRTAPGDLGLRVQDLRNGNFRGLNVTMPHKRGILDHVDRHDASVARAGAANTLVLRHGEVWAFNTDGPALREELRMLGASTESLAGTSCLVLGSGGAARVAVAELALEYRAAHIEVRARAFDASAEGRARARNFEAELRGGLGRDISLGFGPLQKAPADSAFACVVQCSSDGMHRPNAEQQAGNGNAVADAVEWSALTKTAIVLDIVYLPRETVVLKRARAAGLAHQGGLGMLARQGAAAFAVWLECEPPYEVMLAALQAQMLAAGA
jgi:shikimate dehydrogenase